MRGSHEILPVPSLYIHIYIYIERERERESVYRRSNNYSGFNPTKDNLLIEKRIVLGVKLFAVPFPLTLLMLHC